MTALRRRGTGLLTPHLAGSPCSVFVLLWFYLFLALLHSMQDFSSPARDRTCLLPWEHGVLNTGPPGKSPSSIFPVAACCSPPLTKVCMPLPTTSTTTCIHTHTEHVYLDEDISNLGHFCSLYIHTPPPTDISLLGHLGNACRWQHISGFFRGEWVQRRHSSLGKGEAVCTERFWA